MRGQIRNGINAIGAAVATAPAPQQLLPTNELPWFSMRKSGESSVDVGEVPLVQNASNCMLPPWFYFAPTRRRLVWIRLPNDYWNFGLAARIRLAGVPPLAIAGSVGGTAGIAVLS